MLGNQGDKPTVKVYKTGADADAADREMYRKHRLPQRRLDLAFEIYHRHYGDRIGRLAQVYKIIEREGR